MHILNTRHLLSVVAVIDIQRCLLEILSDLPAGGIFRVTGEITGIDQRRLMYKRCQDHICNLRIIQEKQTVFVFRGVGSGFPICQYSDGFHDGSFLPQSGTEDAE